MPSRSFLSADSYANMYCSKSVYQPRPELRRSPRLLAKSNINELVRRILNIPIYVPKLVSAADTYSSADRVRDIASVKTYLNRAEQLHTLTGRDALLARAINIACLYIYLCENPSLIRHYERFRQVIRNKRDEFIKSLNENCVKYSSDPEFNRTSNILIRIFSTISVML